jgi:TonB-linked SusC/RagA family outer membrane protein
VKNETMDHVCDIIEKQTSLTVYRTEDERNPNRHKPITLTVKNETLKQVLDKFLPDRDLEWEIENGDVVIFEKNKVWPEKKIDSMIMVTGIVTDDKKGPLPGVTVIAVGTGKVVATDSAGRFSISVINTTAHLLARYIGFYDQQKSIKLKNNLHIIMFPKEDSLNEVVVIAYGTTSKEKNTGSIGHVTNEIITKQSVTNPLQALAGTTSGLFITQNSGVPGSGLKVLIRGQKSLIAGSNPFFVIDGVPYPSMTLNYNGIAPYEKTQDNPTIGTSPLDYINPVDILSIDILKDADATAIYGSRGANGVVLITTRNAKIGPTRVSATFYTGEEKITRKLKLCDTRQYLEMRREAKRNDKIDIEAYEHDLNGNWDPQRNADWQKELIGGTASLSDMQLNVSGGKPKFQYFVSGGHHKGNAVFIGNTPNERYSLHTNLNTSLFKDHFKANFYLNYTYGEMKLPGLDLTKTAVTMAPNAPALYDSAGNINWGVNNIFNNNPASQTKRPYQNKVHNVISNALLTYNINNNFSIKTSFGIVYNKIAENSKIFKSSFNPTAAATKPLQTIFGNGNVTSWIIEPQLNYQQTFGRSSLNVLFGATFQNEIVDRLKQSASGFQFESQMDDIKSAIQSTIATENIYSEYRYAALFGRVGYDLDGKYLVNISGRRDASSRFGKGNQLANFGAIGVGWIFSKENFFKDNLDFLSLGKLRASYGTAGSDQIPDYGYLASYTSVNVNQYQGVQGVIPSRPANPNFRWELNKTGEVALELGFFKNKISTTIAYFRTRSSNQLVGYSLAPSTGFQTIQYNLDAVIQNSGLEIDLKSNNIQTSSFNWTTSLNLTIPKNKLISFPGLSNSTYANKYVIGKSTNIEKLYITAGVDPLTGIYEIENKDGVAGYSAGDQQFIQNMDPAFYGGLQNNVKYKLIQLDFLLQFVKQSGFNYLYYTGLPGQFNQNQPVDILNRWKAPGDIAPTQKFSSLSGGPVDQIQNLFINSNRLVTDASYIRFKYISLSVQLPPKWMRLKMNEAHIFFRAQNLLTITKYQGLDPENRELGLPPLKTKTVGFTITF